jgi:hypothetical protein
VLRIYKSVSEILTGFDIDCSGAAYDGKQVYCTPRALQSFMTQINHIDLSRRSPSYESRLSKYGHRGFEVYWPDLDRSRVDPTIFERNFQRTLGLARLLVLERLPTSSARDQYTDKRREERGRPRIDRYHRNLRALVGNIKEDHEDEVADWLTEEEVSNYHTFTIPYGPKFHAKRIEKLCYTRDLRKSPFPRLQEPAQTDMSFSAQCRVEPTRRQRGLPASSSSLCKIAQAVTSVVLFFANAPQFGRFEDVAHDCCGYCPVPETEDEKQVAEEEQKVFVSGRISFMKDDPGRQVSKYGYHFSRSRPRKTDSTNLRARQSALSTPSPTTIGPRWHMSAILPGSAKPSWMGTSSMSPTGFLRKVPIPTRGITLAGPLFILLL